MKAYVITIMGMEQSAQAAKRCVETAKREGIDVKYFDAVTPTTCEQYADDEKIGLSNFREKYSRYKNALAAFMSHYTLWKKCYIEQEPIIIFEHDAVIMDDIPSFFKGDIVNLGAPSYGKFNTPTTLGEGPLQSKAYLPGAHAYYITPKGAEKLLMEAKRDARPADLFINSAKFKINEIYPWPVMADDSFTTIQRDDGIQAKHNVLKGKKMDILHVK